MKATTAATFIQGHVSIQQGDGWIQPWRLPFDQIELFPSPDNALRTNASHTSGVRLRCATNSRTLRLLVEPQADAAPRLFDLTIGGELLQTIALPANADTVEFSLPETAAPRPVELWLPSNAQVRIRGLEGDPAAAILPVPDWRPRWTVYGSSITKCGAASSPARTWPAVVARRQNLNLTSLGFGGQCHLDPLIGLLIRDLPADFITLKLGINVHGGGSLSPRTFKPAVIGLVRIIREKQPRTPLALVSPIISPPRETHPSNGLSLQNMREEICDAARRLQAAGDLALRYFDGLELFGAAQTALMPDALHPNGEGYELLGNRFADLVLPLFAAALPACRTN